jgi:hypothetical protein
MIGLKGHGSSMRRRVIGIWSKQSWAWTMVVDLSLIASCSAIALAGNTITGVARNQTRGQVAAGDEVILLRLDMSRLDQAGLDQARPNHGMQEEARTTTDSRGSFTLAVRFPHKAHLLRVVHQGVNYDHQVSAGDVVTIDVFDAAAKVQGVAGTIEIIRTGTNGNLLHVSDMVEIRNDSNPPLTQAGERTFEVYLPAHAKIDSVLAAGPGNIGLMISATPVPGEPGHYSVNFPLRPGPTKFAFNYDLAYDGQATFRTKNVYPVQQLVVMIPATMKFTSSSTAFQVLPGANNSYQVEAANQVKVGEGPEFEISGVGAVPALRTQSPTKAPVAARPTPPLSGLSGPGARVQERSAVKIAPASGILRASSRLRWWVVGASAVFVFGVCGFLLWRRERVAADGIRTAIGETQPSGQRSEALAEALKEELSQLEMDRVRGTVSIDEYASVRQVLEGTVKRALARGEVKP